MSLFHKTPYILTLLLYNLQEVEVLEKGPRYYRLRSAVRVYQYIDSIPLNFVDGVVDFYVDTKRGKLDYKALRLDVYTDDDAIKHSSLQKGIVDMSNNSLVNWLYNEHISSNGELQATDLASLIQRVEQKLDIGISTPMEF